MYIYIHVRGIFFNLSKSDISGNTSYLLDLEIFHFGDELRFLLCSSPQYTSLLWAYALTPMPWSAESPRDNVNCGPQTEHINTYKNGKGMISHIYSYRSNSNKKTSQTSILVNCPGTHVLMFMCSHIHDIWFINESIPYIFFRVSLFTVHWFINVCHYIRFLLHI